MLFGRNETVKVTISFRRFNYIEVPFDKYIPLVSYVGTNDG